jgi:hypothetical protein
MTTPVRSNPISQALHTTAPRASEGRTVSAKALLNDITTLLGSGQLAVSVEKALLGEKKRIENLSTHYRAGNNG